MGGVSQSAEADRRFPSAGSEQANSLVGNFIPLNWDHFWEFLFLEFQDVGTALTLA